MPKPLLVFLLLFAYVSVMGACESPGQVADDSLDAETRALVAEKRKEGLQPNRLIHEKSPYLLQHAFNPVDWYPWGEEAFEKARQENKPIFLSVGYSTCYWCHVMEREVFESDSLAALLNAYMVSVKVDREERPDVDRVYMTALQAMSGSGGWPMSLLLTPDRKPFFGATYIPPDSRNGRPGFGQIIRRVQEVWTQQPEQVQAQADKVAQYLDRASAPQTVPTDVGAEVLDNAFAWYETNYDSTYGGFGQAPKFPRPVSLDFLLSYYERTGRRKALDMTLVTLGQMARGGMYDHVGEGFHRYSTDAQWRVPHFEKMLYDQAQLVNAYLRAYQITKEERYADVARNVLAYVDRMMRHPEGGFYSAEDAESAFDAAHPDEKEEGVCYLWTRAEIDDLLAPQAAAVFAYVYGVEEDGNALQDPHQVFVGKNILYQAHSFEEAAARFDHSEQEIVSILKEAREALFAIREKRPKPHHDDKILLSWNGLMIAAYANAYAALGDAAYREAAETSATFLLETLGDPATGRLKRRYRNGEARFDANLEDYAFFVHGLIDLYRATHEQRWLDHAVRLTADQIARFYDEAQGGFFDTTGEDATLLVRSKEAYDGAEPSGNSVALLNLARLYEITGEEVYKQKAEQSLAYFGQRLQRGPSAIPLMLVALDRLRR